jgi:hypothetical protein
MKILSLVNRQIIYDPNYWCVALTARCDSVVTYNTRDFVGIELFGIRAIAPAEFLRAIGALELRLSLEMLESFTRAAITEELKNVTYTS